MTSHYTWGSVTTLHDVGGVLGRPLDNFMVTALGSCVKWSLEVDPCNLSRREHGSCDLPLHTGSQVLSPQNDMDVYVKLGTYVES